MIRTAGFQPALEHNLLHLFDSGGETVDLEDLPTDMVKPTLLEALLALLLVGAGYATTALVGRIGAPGPQPAGGIGSKSRKSDT